MWYYKNVPQVNRHKLDKRTQSESLDLLLETIYSVQNRQELKLFINDLLTPTEKIMLLKRFSIAYFLIEKESYDNICNWLKVSRGTVGSIQRVLATAGEGYRLAVRRLIRKEKIKNFFEKLDDLLILAMPLPRGKTYGLKVPKYAR